MSMLEQRLEQRRQHVDRLAAMRSPTFTLEGTRLLEGSGEALITVNFPIRFWEKPFFTFGGELAANHAPEDTNYPVISGVVARWETIEKPGLRVYYAGAVVAVVALGQDGQKIHFHYQFRGRGFRNPDAPEPELDEEL